MEVDIRQDNAMSIHRGTHLNRLPWAHLSGTQYVGVLVDDVLVGSLERLQDRLNALVALGKCRRTAIKSHRLPTTQSCD